MSQNWRARRAAKSEQSTPPIETTSASVAEAGSEIELRSLAPNYREHQHASYVRHLRASLSDAKNRNIALTGRYGTGKSSILDKFLEAEQRENRRQTLRISINTLGPDEDEDLTNRIQKELVKQLVYRAEPGKIRRSRFARRKELAWWEALLEAFAAGVVLVGLLWLFGIRPDANAVGTENVILSVVVLLALVISAVWAVRRLVGNRLISQFSTGGTSISFEKQPDSYFDEYLDEIMAFFDATEPALVVFEDLDRFDDPRIFDSLRELNTLVNASAHWKRREEPLRFIYAIKDSLFEKLGEDPTESGSDARGAATPSEPKIDDTEPYAAVPSSKDRLDAAGTVVERANRTKFFEVVVPVVPFLSHNNARDLLAEAIDDLGLPAGTDIGRGLVDLVARHTTDMRLMINICNEFVVFAQRLLWIDTPAPGMKADDLFALVVYKNFHLADFERLAHRGSALDMIEHQRQNLIRDAIEQLQQEKRDLSRAFRLNRKQNSVAQMLGDRLAILSTDTGPVLTTLTLGEKTYPPEAIRQPSFWRDLAQVRTLDAHLHNSRYGHTYEVTFGEDRLVTLFPEGMDPYQWREFDAAELAPRRAKIDHEVAALRGADFTDLAKEKRYTTGGRTFDQHLESILESELARDLVRRGFVNRYYAEYSAVFYGKFIGVDVANFFRNSVWPNEMSVHAKFTTPNAVENLLAQVPAGFTSSRSALNIQVVDYLVTHRTLLAKEVVAFIVADRSEDSVAFLDAFFNDSASQKVQLVQLLVAHPWAGLFSHLAREASVPDEDTRTALLDAALLMVGDVGSYDIDEHTRELVVERHTQFDALKGSHGPETTAAVFEFVRQSGLIAPSLRPLSSTIRRLFVRDGAYALTGDNLRAALSLRHDEPITLDAILKDEAVWHRCKHHITAYLNVQDQDDKTPYAVQTAETLITAVAEQHDDWSDDEVNGVLENSAPTSALPDLTRVPQTKWQAFAAARRITPGAVNLHTYVTVFGVDEQLAQLLVLGPGVRAEIQDREEAEPEVIHSLMVAILNASHVLTSEDRLQLALQLDPEPPHQLLEPTELEPSADNLLAGLLKAELVPDTAATLQHFLTAGWNAVSAAFGVSTAARDFITPDLVSGHLVDLFNDPHVSNEIKGDVVKNLAAYADDGSGQALREAALFAHASKISLPLSQLERAAPHVSDQEHVLWQLARLGDDLEGTDAIRVLPLLGGDFAGFTGGSGFEFDLPATESTKAILDRLKRAGLVELPRGGARNRKKVKLI